MKDQPKKTKYKKYFKMPIKCNKNYINMFFSLSKGFIGLQALENGRITSKQLEAVRKVLVRKLQRQGKIWFMVFPQHAVTAKAGEVRMGRGKGKIKHWVSRTKRGQILIEIGGVTSESALIAFSFAKKKLPIKTKILGPIV
jgi:large subunit ribosomal protein L16